MLCLCVCSFVMVMFGMCVLMLMDRFLLKC